MSILIKGMSMPTSCGSCFVGDRTICSNDCPLVEISPHGKLIDKDALLTNYEEMVLTREYGTCVKVNGIIHAPTIIEADSNLHKQHEEIRDCSTCKYRLYDDYHERYYCYDPDPMNIGCIEWSHWKSKEC